MNDTGLYIVPTPIGNLEDITLRAMRILKEVDLVLSEDTRTSGKLLKHFDIQAKQYPYHQFNEHKVVTGLVERMAAGEKMALITDAGTPGISDPGFLLIRECIKNNIEVKCLPGATAFVPALVQSGLPSDKFFFEGFLPHKKGRETRLKYLATVPYTIVLYESPHRLVKTLVQLITHFGSERKASVSRELTKLHEETVRGTLQEIHDYFNSKTVKGEIVIIIGQPE
jgi:16S rRNA (cytidine1402-2'-O)-methyltransferase